MGTDVAGGAPKEGKVGNASLKKRKRETQGPRKEVEESAGRGGQSETLKTGKDVRNTSVRERNVHGNNIGMIGEHTNV